MFKSVFFSLAYLMFACSVSHGNPFLDEEEKPETGTFHIAEVFDFARVSTLKIMTPDEVKAEEDRIGLENKLFRKALAGAERAWRASEDTKKKMFPKSSIKSRRIKITGTFDSRGKAEEKLEEMELKLEEKAEREEEKEELRNAAKNLSKEKIAASRTREFEREAFLAQARGFFEAQMDELITKFRQEQEEKIKEAGEQK